MEFLLVTHISGFSFPPIILQSRTFSPACSLLLTLLAVFRTPRFLSGTGHLKTGREATEPWLSQPRPISCGGGPCQLDQPNPGTLSRDPGIAVSVSDWTSCRSAAPPASPAQCRAACRTVVQRQEGGRPPLTGHGSAGHAPLRPGVHGESYVGPRSQLGFHQYLGLPFQACLILCAVCTGVCI